MTRCRPRPLALDGRPPGPAPQRRNQESLPLLPLTTILVGLSASLQLVASGLLE